ncbi:MAG: type III-B CRISPR module-associated protein Cmr5 [Candidatus Hydrothermae bacterium]|nr:type III-B CRISPR module-associated protein Cmr5 [Candidatus Hydrothermae bacterium]
MAEIKSLEQERARLAWEFIHKNDVKKNSKDYRAAIRKLPAMILTSGLAQTVAFYLSKGEGKPYYEIVRNMAGSLGKLTGVEDIGTPEKFTKKIKDANHETYILLSNEALKYATWLKRFAEAELEE